MQDIESYLHTWKLKQTFLYIFRFLWKRGALYVTIFS